MTGSIPSSYKGKEGEKTVIEDVEDYVDGFCYSEFSKSGARVFD